MQVLYKSTRGKKEETVTASMAILKGLSEDGGLFVPTSIPKLDVPMDRLSEMTYQETAYEVMSRFLTDFTEEELKDCIARAYDSKFDTEEIAPVKKAGGVYFLELFHGSTIAFKDMALSILPHLMTTAARKNHVKNEIVILTATSGDTGKAAMAGQGSLFFILKTASAPFRKNRWSHKKVKTPQWWESQEILTMLRARLRGCLMIRSWQQSLTETVFSFPLPIPLISAVLCLRSYTMFMRMQNW